MSDLPVPALTPPEPPQPQTLVCANCHAPLNGEYCVACGQRHEPHIHTVAHFAGEALESISHADSRLWRTLWYLFARPGFLTREFFAGRRVAYLPPFRLYLVVSLLFFTIVGLGGGEVSATVEIDEPLSAAEAADVNAVAEQIETGKYGPMSAEQRATIARQLRGIAGQGAAAPPADGSAPAAPAAAGPSIEDKTVDLMTGEGVQNGITQFCTDFKAGMPAGAEATTKQESVLRWCRRYGEEGLGAVGEALAHNIPKAMFVFLPLLALCMKLIYWRPKRYYVEHLLFMVHNHTFVFFLTGLIMLVAMIPGVGDYIWPVNWAAFFYMAWYIYRAMRNVYAQGRALTLTKYFVLGTLYFVAGFGVFLLTLIYSAMTF
jgi:hypothetical protein